MPEGGRDKRQVWDLGDGHPWIFFRTLPLSWLGLCPCGTPCLSVKLQYASGWQEGGGRHKHAGIVVSHDVP